ncbi:MAG: diaminopropionate ammonia-lyase [Haliea sp.]|uniref:diaminopropionate ammonia-lyase n=1 Tax=Haliea sp. TaxID=1932666 RepID=UPI0032EEF73C
MSAPETPPLAVPREPLLVSGAFPSPLRGNEVDLYGAAAREVCSALRRCPAYRPTPLVSLAAGASELGLQALWVKDESSRFSLDSFKALGGAYAVLSLSAERAGLCLSKLHELNALKATGEPSVFCAATDGNHGRSVAAGARLVGARCIIFVHEHVAESRRELLRQGGAELRVIPGHYDDSVAACREQAERNGWTMVADVAGVDDDPKLPIRVTQGYLAMVHEIREQLEGASPSHVFLQAGVGGLAAAVVAAIADFGWQDTRVVIVEPAVAACLRLAAECGEPRPVQGDIDSIMGMLSCGIASVTAWSVLRNRVYAYLTLEEREALAAAYWLLSQPTQMSPLAISPSGAAGAAGLLKACAEPSMRERLGLNASARVLLIATERDVDGLLKKRHSGVVQA